MRKSLYSAAVLAASTALVAGVTAVPAEARTFREMKVCWTAPDGSSGYPIKVVLDGPTSRQQNLASGVCKTWNVKPGAYKVIWANLEGPEPELERRPQHQLRQPGPL